MKGFLQLFIIVISAPLGLSGEFTPRQVVPPFDAIVDPNIVGVEEAGKWINHDELVIGVVIGGESRAYPVNMLTSPTREIINDRLGGKSIAATW